jgi:hypothetical protein
LFIGCLSTSFGQNYPRYYFNKLFKGPETNYDINTSKLISTKNGVSTLIQTASNTPIYFVSNAVGNTFTPDPGTQYYRINPILNFYFKNYLNIW